MTGCRGNESLTKGFWCLTAIAFQQNDLLRIAGS
jgi:hypothetical protein